MLKALELVGFKSFADKTRFEFPAGITVVVGPNGSGKSNIVDAIKWVLGEQSAKSLRGKEMADVIFKGAGGRKVMNTAEATIIFDNREGRLAVDAPEVHVTRRVYRSGEGEYLVNRQPCRLKDIRDMFRGTGVGTDAYSLIEQGKVDQLLQASSRDRRAIFEEAAGISRFKAKKLQAERRLERVDQNLLRLSDIVDEVESRVKTIRNQATKARRYRDCRDRLQQLRTHVGLTDWRRLSREIETLEEEREQTGQLRRELEQTLAEAERQTAILQREGREQQDAIRDAQQRESRCREQIHALHAASQHQRQRADELESQAAQSRRRSMQLKLKADETETQLAQTVALLETALVEQTRLAECDARQRASLDAALAAWKSLQADNERLRGELMGQMRMAASLGNRLSSTRAQLESVRQVAERAQRQLAESESQDKDSLTQLQEFREQERRLETLLASHRRSRDAVAVKLEENRRLVARRKEDVAELLGRRRGLEERVSVLEDLQRRFEGFTDGARELLARARRDPSPPFDQVAGVVADFVDVPVALAPAIDAALGGAAQHVVLFGDGILDWIRRGKLRVTGRLGLQLVRPGGGEAEAPDPLRSTAGVLGRADRLVTTREGGQNLVARLLSRTWIVEDLAVAFRLRGQSPSGARLVTQAGDVIEVNGPIVLGAQHAAGGLVSRRSELRTLRDELVGVLRQIAEGRDEFARIELNVESGQSAAARLEAQIGEAQAGLADCQVQRRTIQDRWERAKRERAALQAEQHAAAEKIEQWEQEYAAAAEALRESEQAIESLESRLAELNRQAEEVESQRRDAEQAGSQTRIDLARAEQQVASLQEQQSRFLDDRRERGAAVLEARRQIQGSLQGVAESHRVVLLASAQAAQLYLDKEAAGRRALDLSRAIREQVERQGELAQLQQKSQRKIRKLEEQSHRCELALNEQLLQRTALAERMRDDYGIDISQGEPEQAEEQGKREQIEAEIADLRFKLNSMGAVNMEALDELDDLEARFEDLNSQLQDLTRAKEALGRIIQRINGDSRRLFLETLEAIRVNFQALYRKAFGGGRADLVLEDPENALESGIDIVATPPGKPSFNNSLLSGGEKALTAVALLLAIFQFRPSPFCVLDEVDAPFDEANVGRFIEVLKAFLGWTKFVIVTHSKKTMTAADTLYGVTMQESGVSKRVSVRFEDVSEDGQISSEALDRQRDDDGQAA